MKWFFIDTDKNTAAWNMAFDEVLMEKVFKEESVVFLRVYRWRPWAISLGYSQNGGNEFDFEKIKNAGYDVVRRTTGGRAVFHAEEITYSITAPIKHPDFNGGVNSNYKKIGAALLKTLYDAGFDELNLQKMKTEDGAFKKNIPNPCFSSTARYEITYSDKKIVGSAQKKTRKTIQQHGSILLGREHLNIVDYMNLNERQKEIYLRGLKRNSISLSEIKNRNVDYKEIAKVFTNGFECEFKCKIEPFVINEQMSKDIERLAIEKYSQREWNKIGN